MRTTLTIYADAAASLERLGKRRNAKRKDLINEALRRRIKEMTAPPRPCEPFGTRAADVGEVLVPLNGVSAVLAAAEGETFK